MKVKLLQSALCDEEGRLVDGPVIELSEQAALELIEKGVAEQYEASPPLIETASVDRRSCAAYFRSAQKKVAPCT